MAIAGILNVGSTNYPVGSTLYGTCDTAAGTAAKVAIVSGFDSNDCMVPGITVHIKFTNSNTVANPTLAIKALSSGTATTAKSIMRYGTTAPSTTAKTSWQAGSVISFTYDGTYWQMNGWLNDDSTYTVNNGKLTIQKNGTAVATFTANQSGNSTANITGTFTDENVKQTNITTQTGTYRLLMSATGDDTNRTEAALKTSKATYNASKEAFTFGSRNSATAGKNSVAEGLGVYATGDYSHAEGSNTCASGSASHAEGHKTSASGNYAHAEGAHTLASGNYSHAEGGGDTDSLIATTVASGLYSHAEGYWTTASGNGAHAEGGYSTGSYIGTIASGENSHAEGRVTSAIGENSHAEGLSTCASGDRSHAEGNETKATAYNSHAEGRSTIASGEHSHAEGFCASAAGYTSHAEGYYTIASGHYSHTEGYYTTANHRSQHVFGEYNKLDASTATANNRGTYVEIVGNGTSSARSNARTLDWDGNEWIAGQFSVDGVDNTWLNIGKTPSIHVKKISSPGGVMPIIAGDTKGGRMLMATYPSATNGNERLYFNYYKDATLSGTTNKIDAQFMFDGSTNQVMITPEGFGDACGFRVYDSAKGLQLHINKNSHNRGLYDEIGKWLIYADINNVVRIPSFNSTGYGDSITGFGNLELYPGSASANHGGFIDFHFNQSTADYTHRLLATTGNKISAYTSIANASDRRLKENIIDVDDKYVDLIRLINPKQYNFKSSKDNVDIGFIAQEVEDALLEIGIDPDKMPLIIKPVEDAPEPANYYSLDYGEMTSVLWKICQSQQKEIDDLKAQTANLEKEIDELKAKLEK